MFQDRRALDTESSMAHYPISQAPPVNNPNIASGLDAFAGIAPPTRTRYVAPAGQVNPLRANPLSDQDKAFARALTRRSEARKDYEEMF